MIKIFSRVYDCSRTHLTPIIVDEDVTHDGKHPPFEIDVVDILLFIVQDFQSRVLHKILSSFPVGGQLACEIKQIA